MNRILRLIFLLLLLGPAAWAQDIRWAADGNAYYQFEDGELVAYDLPAQQRRVIFTRQQLTPTGQQNPLEVDVFAFSSDFKKVLLFANTQRVWRINSRGEYWVLYVGENRLQPLGKGLPPASLMFAKFSPDGNRVAYVSKNNLYVEELATGTVKQLTTDGTDRLINGTFDWAYEEEFSCRDGFRWSPDGQRIAYWQIDATKIRNFLMINNTDSIYPFNVPVEYPKVGESPSACRVGEVDINTAQTRWVPVPGDPQQHYIVRLEYIPNTTDLLIQQLNRKQNHSKIFRYQPATQQVKVVFEEKDEAWVDVYEPGDSYTVTFTNRFLWLSGGKEFIWMSEKEGWRQLYRLSVDGKPEIKLTKGAFDVIDLSYVDEKGGYLYFIASPENATQRYLYRQKIGGKETLERLSPADQSGSHGYDISPNGKFALHTFSNTHTRPLSEMVSLPKHEPLDQAGSIAANLAKAQVPKRVEFFKVKTEDGVEMDGWVVKPTNFDPNKKYPVVFYVYTEPASQTVRDAFGTGMNRYYKGDMAADGYLYVSLDNRGTPAPKGRAWRKAIYRNIGVVNIRDQAMAAKEVLKWPYADPTRVAVWGWSGGGAATLNLLFQHPEIYQTGIAGAAITYQLTYDNIYQERYMGLPQENLEDFVKGSPITHAKNLRGNLLYIHGTGDDNVHYQNAELLINELIRQNKVFQFMPYPNRSHGLREGQGTGEHIRSLYTQYLKTHCPPGGR